MFFINDEQKTEESNKEIKEENNKIENQLEKVEKEKKLIQNQIEEMNSFKGEISARVKRELLISAQIKLVMNNTSLDTSKSKYMISERSANKLGKEVYEKGEQKIDTKKCEQEKQFTN